MTRPNLRLIAACGVLALGIGVALFAGWTRLAIVIACVAALAMIEGAIRLWAEFTRPSAPPEAPDANACAACGYDLRGLRGAGVCPECGSAYHPPDVIEGSDTSTSPPPDRAIGA